MVYSYVAKYMYVQNTLPGVYFRGQEGAFAPSCLWYAPVWEFCSDSKSFHTVAKLTKSCLHHET